MNAEAGASAARRYKDITGELNAAVERMKHADAERVQQLRAALEGLEAEREASAARDEQLTEQAREHWENALDVMWNEPWMTPPRMPKPDREAAPGDLDYLEAVVEQRLGSLRDAVRRRGLLRRR